MTVCSSDKSSLQLQLNVKDGNETQRWLSNIGV